MSSERDRAAAFQSLGDRTPVMPIELVLDMELIRNNFLGGLREEFGGK